MKRILRTIGKYLAEIYVLIGMFFVLFATYKLNVIAFYYVFGLFFIAAGLFIAKYSERR